MHVKITRQISIYETFAEHEIRQELKSISKWLDRHVRSIGINPAQGVVDANWIRHGMIEACKLIRSVRHTFSVPCKVLCKPLLRHNNKARTGRIAISLAVKARNLS